MQWAGSQAPSFSIRWVCPFILFGSNWCWQVGWVPLDADSSHASGGRVRKQVMAKASGAPWAKATRGLCRVNDPPLEAGVLDHGSLSVTCWPLQLGYLLALPINPSLARGLSVPSNPETKHWGRVQVLMVDNFHGILERCPELSSTYCLLQSSRRFCGGGITLCLFCVSRQVELEREWV